MCKYVCQTKRCFAKCTENHFKLPILPNLIVATLSSHVKTAGYCYFDSLWRRNYRQKKPYIIQFSGITIQLNFSSSMRYKTYLKRLPRCFRYSRCRWCTYQPRFVASTSNIIQPRKNLSTLRLQSLRVTENSVAIFVVIHQWLKVDSGMVFVFNNFLWPYESFNKKNCDSIQGNLQRILYQQSTTN